MNINDLKNRGAFVDRLLVKANKKWERIGQDGRPASDEVSFFVRRVSYMDFKSALSGGSESMASVKLDPDCLLICACIRLGDDGEELLEYSDAESLEPALFKLFIEAINDVYGGHNTDPKPLAQSKNSGAKSSAKASAAKRSKKPKSA